MYRKAVYYQLIYPSSWWKCYQHLQNKFIQASTTCDNGFEDFRAEYSSVDFTWFSECWITLAPHDTDWLSLDFIKVHCVNGSFGIGWLLEIDVSIAKRASSNHITTDSNWQDWTSLKIINDHLIHRRFSLPEKIFRKAWLLWLHGEGLRRKDSPSDKTVGLSSFSTTEKNGPTLKNLKI